MSYTYIICFPVKEHLAVTVSKNYPMVGNMFFEVVYPLRKIMEFILKRYLPNFSIRRANSKDLSKISGVYSKVLGLKWNVLQFLFTKLYYFRRGKKSRQAQPGILRIKYPNPSLHPTPNHPKADKAFVTPLVLPCLSVHVRTSARIPPIPLKKYN